MNEWNQVNIYLIVHRVSDLLLGKQFPQHQVPSYNLKIMFKAFDFKYYFLILNLLHLCTIRPVQRFDYLQQEMLIVPVVFLKDLFTPCFKINYIYIYLF